MTVHDAITFLRDQPHRILGYTYIAVSITIKFRRKLKKTIRWA
jgi:hypothetical protein